VRGEQAPASATLGSVQIQAQQASSVYDFIRENIGLELEKFFEEIVIPQMLRDKKENHFLKLQGNDKEVEDIRKKIVDDYFGDRKVEKEDYERALKEVRAKNSVWVEVQKGFYDNLEYYVRVVITGEGVNVQTDITNINQVLSLVAKSPDMLNNPVLKRLTFKLMSKLGMNISELEVLQDESAGQQEQLSNLNAQQNVQPITAI
jgi:hypothetical protein